MLSPSTSLRAGSAKHLPENRRGPRFRGDASLSLSMTRGGLIWMDLMDIDLTRYARAACSDRSLDQHGHFFFGVWSDNAGAEDQPLWAPPAQAPRPLGTMACTFLRLLAGKVEMQRAWSVSDTAGRHLCMCGCAPPGIAYLNKYAILVPGFILRHESPCRPLAPFGKVPIPSTPLGRPSTCATTVLSKKDDAPMQSASDLPGHDGTPEPGWPSPPRSHVSPFPTTTKPRVQPA